jgi:putative pyoverdin transport system ATP-binding/permease protein
MRLFIKTKTKNEDVDDEIKKEKADVKKINFLSFLKKESTGPLYNIPILAALAGIANAVLLAIINASVKSSSENGAGFSFMVMFFLAYAIYVLCQRNMLHKSNVLLEGIINNIRIRLSDKIRRADLLGLESIGETKIYNRLTQETLIISDAVQILIMSLQSTVMLFFVAAYIAILSRIAFIIIVFLTLLAINYFLNNYKKMRVSLKEENVREMNFFGSLTDVLKGTKEIRLDRKKSSAIFSYIKKIALKLKKIKIFIANKYVDNNLVPNTFYFLLIGVIIFILPRLSTTHSAQLVQLTMAILFMTGPLDSIVNAVQTFGKVDYAVSNIYAMERNLERLIEIHEDHPNYDGSLKGVSSFKRIKLENIEFAYQDVKGNNNGFSIGPISMEIPAGETLFIVGGNGSGKTTFLKVLCQLYYPGSGSIRLDDIPVIPSNVVDYRQLFSGVFSDFHLFQRLYSMEGVKQEEVEELLRIMQIEHKTKFLGDRFSTINLSTGQRKRLALLISLLEDKPVYIFDEWAADQDPEFRQYFYEVILKDLKDLGKTVIAASHDDRFFHYADRVIKLDYGKITKDYENGTNG